MVVVTAVVVALSTPLLLPLLLLPATTESSPAVPSVRPYERRVFFRRPTSGMPSAVVAAVVAGAAAAEAPAAAGDAAADADASERTFGPGLVDHNRTDLDGLLLLVGVETRLSTRGPAVKQEHWCTAADARHAPGCCVCGARGGGERENIEIRRAAKHDSSHAYVT